MVKVFQFQSSGVLGRRAGMGRLGFQGCVL